MSKYDQVFYPGHPFIQTHPDRLATIAHLLGLRPPAIDRCRVLELACGDGGNLIPMALTLPDARFTGVDLAAQPIKQGHQTIASLRLANITLQQADLLDFHPDGEFDYIITHGLYSWCPSPVRDAILRITSGHLAPNGIAYVSYNALPGGRVRQMLREMMLFHARDFTDPMERATQARALLRLISEGRAKPDVFTAWVQSEVERMTDRDLWLLFHDELGEVYEPVYLHEFTAHAERHGLQYLADANLYNLQPANLTPDAQQAIADITLDDRVLRQQYADFVLCRRFHHTLLCRQALAIDALPTPGRLDKLYISTTAAAVPDPTDLTRDVEVEFKGPLASGMKTAHPIAKALMAALIEESPQAIAFRDLLPRARATRRRTEAAQILLATSLAGLTDLHTAPFPLTNKVTSHPIASPLARHQASQGRALTTLTHCTVETNPGIELDLLPLLDGKRSVPTLARKLKVSKEHLDQVLKKLARLGLLAANSVLCFLMA
ncbi:MAG TPA: class I SAM-dependent methyltransferase [Bryobacteraceae bacterium]